MPTQNTVKNSEFFFMVITFLSVFFSFIYFVHLFHFVRMISNFVSSLLFSILVMCKILAADVHVIFESVNRFVCLILKLPTSI